MRGVDPTIQVAVWLKEKGDDPTCYKREPGTNCWFRTRSNENVTFPRMSSEELLDCLRMGAETSSTNHGG